MSVNRESLFYPIMKEGKTTDSFDPFVPGGVSEYLWKSFEYPRRHFFNTSDATESSYWNIIMQDYMNQYNYDMWKENNEYNSPAEQVKRMMAAGLNPNLFYSQGTPGNSSSPFKADRADYQTDRRAYKMQVAQMVLDQINQFATSVGNLVDTGTKIRQRVDYEIPMLANDRFLSNLNRDVLENTIFGDADYMKLHAKGDYFPTFKIGDKQYYIGTTSGQMPFYSPMILDQVSKYSQRYYQNTFQHAYQAHMEKMYPDQERRAEAEAIIKEYIAEFEKDVPREFRWMIPMFFSMMKMF